MSSLDEAARVLRAGGVVACPTETLVGLLADAANPAAVEAVLALKGRAAERTLALLVPDLSSACALAELSPAAVELARAHWPGPLTLVARAAVDLHRALVQEGKVGMRVPGPSLAADLARHFGGALTATSANLAGAPPAARTADLEPKLRSQVGLVLEGESPGGPPSTIVDVSATAPRLLRPGAVSLVL